MRVKSSKESGRAEILAHLDTALALVGQTCRFACVALQMEL
jgi:hypothetical protein